MGLIIRKKKVDKGYPTELHFDSNLQNFYDFKTIKRQSQKSAENYQHIVYAIQRDPKMLVTQEDGVLKVSLNEERMPRGYNWYLKSEIEQIILNNIQCEGDYQETAADMFAITQKHPTWHYLSSIAKIDGRLYTLAKKLEHMSKDKTDVFKVL